MTQERFVQSLEREKRMGKECRSTQKGYGLAGSDEYRPISGFDCLKRVWEIKEIDKSGYFFLVYYTTGHKRQTDPD